MKYVALSALATILVSGPALAGFEVISPTTASQEVEMELNNTVRVGGVVLGENVSEHEIGVKYGALKYWEVGLAFELESTRGEGVSAGGFELNSKLAILGGETASTPQLFDLAIYTSFDFNFEDDDDRALRVGPVMGVNLDPVTIVTNGFFVVPLANSASKTGFEYALGTMVDVSENVAVGFEAHGEVPSIVDGPTPLGTQEHYIGPAIAFSFEAEEDREVGVRLGSFFGLTDATPTVGLSANIEFGF